MMSVLRLGLGPVPDLAPPLLRRLSGRVRCFVLGMVYCVRLTTTARLL